MNSDKIKFICVFATPRTGSSYLFNLARKCPELYLKDEMFHGHTVRLSRKDQQALGAVPDAPIKDPSAFLKWRYDNPIVYLDAMATGGKDRTLMFKVFPGHLSQTGVKSIIARDDACFLILRRKPIDCFVSNTKALIVSTYSVVDTTQIKPELDPERFLRWCNQTLRWYRFVRRQLAMHGKRYADLTYESDIEGRGDANVLDGFIAKLAELGLSSVTRPSEVSGIAKQDRETKTENKVANWDAFKAAMEKSEISSRMLKWAMTVPTAEKVAPDVGRFRAGSVRAGG